MCYVLQPFNNLHKYFDCISNVNKFCYIRFQPLCNRNEIFASVRPQIQIDRRGKVYTPMHMRYHLIKFVQENFQLVQLLVSAPLEARKMTLQQYVTKMARGNTCGYEVTLLILSHMFQLPFLVIRSDMLWLSQNVQPTECPIVLVQIADGSFLGTRTKKPVSIGTVPRIKLTVKKSETQNIMHSTPARKQRGVRNDFQPLDQEILSPYCRQRHRSKCKC